MISKIEEALEDIRQGKMVILVDDEDRENEGDLTMAAEKATPEAINFMAKYGRGLICLSMTEKKLSELRIPMMVSENTSRFQTAFTISIDARKGVTTGISAADRATTILTAVDDNSLFEDLVTPGHIFPRAQRPLRSLAGVQNASRPHLKSISSHPLSSPSCHRVWPPPSKSRRVLS